MLYHLNFGYVWTHFDKLAWGLLLSLELAFVSILIGMVIGLALALVYTGRGTLLRGIVAGYVEFIRNIPLLLLVYLVFYGVPSVGGFAYDATTSSSSPCPCIPVRIWSRCFAPASLPSRKG